MLSEKQKQIIRLLLTSKEGYNVNQISRILNISVSWAHETLKFLEGEGVLNSVKIANSILFRINWDNPKTEKVCDFILIDDNSKNKDLTEVKSLETKPILNKGYNVISTTSKNDNVYSLGSSSSSPNNIDSPYSQAKAIQNMSNFAYTPVPMGNQGVSNVLFAYASSGAFGGSSGYSASSNYSSISVPPDTLGSRVSKNVSGFTLSMHTTEHKEAVNTGCRYCGPEIRAPL